MAGDGGSRPALHLPTAGALDGKPDVWYEVDMSLAYEQLLDRDRRWALSEGSRHFEGKSAVQEALRKITRRLEEMGIPYAVAGGMALFQHGFRRFTEDVDILVTAE